MAVDNEQSDSEARNPYPSWPHMTHCLAGFRFALRAQFNTVTLILGPSKDQVLSPFGLLSEHRTNGLSYSRLGARPKSIVRLDDD